MTGSSVGTHVIDRNFLPKKMCDLTWARSTLDENWPKFPGFRIDNTDNKETQLRKWVTYGNQLRDTLLTNDHLAAWKQVLALVKENRLYIEDEDGSKRLPTNLNELWTIIGKKTWYDQNTVKKERLFIVFLLGFSVMVTQNGQIKLPIRG